MSGELLENAVKGLNDGSDEPVIILQLSGMTLRTKCNLISDKRRMLVCLLSVGLGSGLFLALGLHRHTEKLFGRWYGGLSLIFLSIFTALVVLSLHGRVVKARWLFPICIGLSYLAAIIAYLSYFVVWEPERAANMLAHVAIFPDLKILLLMPIVTLAWLFGAFVGTFYLCLERLARVT